MTEVMRRYPMLKIHGSAVLCGVALWIAPAPAAAQSAATPNAVAPAADASGDAPSGAAESAESGGVVVTEKARAHFRAGVGFLEDPDGARYEDAYRQFRLAYEESPSWKVLGNLGISAMYLERDGEAIDALETYLSQGANEIDPVERQQLEKDLMTLRAAVATVSITGSPAGLKVIDRRMTNQGTTITNQYVLPPEGSLVLRVRPGNHTITAHLSGHDDQVWELDAKAASAYERGFSLAEPQEQAVQPPTSPTDEGASRPVPTSVWVGAGVTGALLIGTVTSGILALDKNSQYQEANESGDPSAADLRGQVDSMNLVTDVFLGATVIAGAVTAVLYFTRPAASPHALRVDPVLGPGVMACTLSGSF